MERGTCFLKLLKGHELLGKKKKKKSSSGIWSLWNFYVNNQTPQYEMETQQRENNIFVSTFFPLHLQKNGYIASYERSINLSIQPEDTLWKVICQYFLNTCSEPPATGAPEEVCEYSLTDFPHEFI